MTSYSPQTHLELVYNEHLLFGNASIVAFYHCSNIRAGVSTTLESGEWIFAHSVHVLDSHGNFEMNNATPSTGFLE